MDHPGLFYLEQDLRRSLRKAWYQTARYLEQHPEEDAGQVWARVLERNVHAFAYQLPMNLYDWGITEGYSELSHAAEVSLRVSKTSSEDPIRKGKNYQVKKGDTLIGIARRYGITLEQLYEVNPGLKEQDPRKLAVGTVLTLPYGAPFRMKAQIEVFVPLHQDRILEAYYNLGLLRRLTGVKALDLQYYRDPRSPSPLAPRSSFGNHPPTDDQPPDSWDKWNRRDTPSPSPYAPWERNSNHGKGPGPWIDGYGERNRLDDNPAYPHYLMSAYDLRRKGTVQVQPYRKPPLKLSPHVNEPNQAFQLAPLIPALEEVSGKVIGRSLLAGAGWILTLLCLSGDTRREPLEMLPRGEGWPGPISSSVYDQLSAEEAQRYNELRYKKAAGKASEQESRDFQELEEKLVEGDIVAEKDYLLEQVKNLDSQGGHSYADHGAHTTEFQHLERLRSGETPSGRQAAIPDVSSKFSSDEIHLEAYEDALNKLDHEKINTKGGLKKKVEIKNQYFPNSGISYSLDMNGDLIRTVSDKYTAVFRLDQSNNTYKLVTLFP